jgi:hypothetical protein
MSLSYQTAALSQGRRTGIGKNMRTGDSFAIFFVAERKRIAVLSVFHVKRNPQGMEEENVNSEPVAAADR